MQYYGASPYIGCGQLATDYAGVTVFPAEIIKMPALVGLQKASKRCNDVP